MLRKILFINPDDESITNPLMIQASSPVTAMFTNNGPPPNFSMNHSHAYIPACYNRFNLTDFYRSHAKKYIPYHYRASESFIISPRERIIIIFNDKNTCLKTIKKNRVVNNPNKKAHLALLIKNTSYEFKVIVPKNAPLIDMLCQTCIKSSPAWIQQLDVNKENENICPHC